MVLGIKKLLKLVKEKKLVENLSERELKNPEGAGFDLRVGEIFRIEGKGFLGVEERETPNAKKVKNRKSYILKPNEYVLVKTIEKVNLPENLIMFTFPRSTLQRCGILLLSTQTAPGYKGNLVFGLKNLGNCNFELEIGARICHVVFCEVKGGGIKYKGQWQGGRVDTKGIEKQI
jgi:deoxycytidine triphosphate deaminase